MWRWAANLVVEAITASARGIATGAPVWERPTVVVRDGSGVRPAESLFVRGALLDRIDRVAESRRSYSTALALSSPGAEKFGVLRSH